MTIRNLQGALTCNKETNAANTIDLQVKCARVEYLGHENERTLGIDKR